MRKRYLILIVMCIVIVISSKSFYYDENAVIDMSLNNTVKDGYFIIINSNVNYPYLYFRDVNNHQYNFATYNYKYQHWAGMLRGFDPERIDLASYYKQVLFSSDKLNRRQPVQDAEYVAADKDSYVKKEEEPGTDGTSTDIKKDESTTSQKSTGERTTTNYDEFAVPDESMDNKQMGQYRLNYNLPYNFIIFFHVKDKVVHAIYNAKFQYWTRKDAQFDMTDIDLRKLFTKIDQEHLDRKSIYETGKTDEDNKVNKETDAAEKDAIKMKMDGQVMNGYRVKIDKFNKWIGFYKVGYPDMGQASYDYGKKTWLHAFGDFYTDDVDFTLFFDDAGGKNAVSYDNWGESYKHIRTVLNKKNYKYLKDQDFKDFLSYARRCDVDARQIDFFIKVAHYPAVRERMQYYFDMHKRGRGVRPVEIFINSDTVNLTIIEMIPRYPSSHNLEYTPVNQLKDKIKTYFEACYKKGFNIRSARYVLNYEEFGTIPENNHPLVYQRNYLDEHVNGVAGNNSLALYYFVDKVRMREFPRIKASNPMGLGAGMLDFDINALSVLHEFGHTLMMQHHFDLDRHPSDPEDLNNHTSSACIMNYQFKSVELCPLCRYALHIPPDK